MSVVHQPISTTIHEPSRFFTSQGDPYKEHALLILNQPISSKALLQRLWSCTSYRICADGGANRLYDLFDKHEDLAERDMYLPNRIHGDLDSLLPPISAFYSSKGVPISRNPDQQSTDFGKCMSLIRQQQPQLPTKPSQPLNHPALSPPPTITTILILGSISGRLDQGLGLLHEMAREQAAHPAQKLVLVSECGVSFILEAGRTSIILFRDPVVLFPSSVGITGITTASSTTTMDLNNKDNNVRENEIENENEDDDSRRGSRKPKRKGAIFTPNVGILPIYGPATISTTGLEWDVKDWETRMGVQVSTSNHVAGERVEVVVGGVDGGGVGVLFTVERVEDGDLPEL